MAPSVETSIRPARTPGEFRALHKLFSAYADELGVDLSFQGFADELADIAGTYEVALIAGPATDVQGCIALKRHDDRRCEMKRLYVRPDARDGGLGRRLCDAIIAEARTRFYREMVLDSMEQRMGPAIRLYEALEFKRCAPYYCNPEPDAVYMMLAF